MNNSLIDKIDALPPLPKSVIELEEFRKAPNKEALDLLNIIEQDPLIITTLFYRKINSNWFFLVLIIFSLFPSALSNFYHLSESHFYFQLLLMILGFYSYHKFDGLKCLSINFVLSIFSIFNMAAVSIIYFLTFAVFFFLKFIFEKNKKNLYYSILIFLFPFLYFL